MSRVKLDKNSKYLASFKFEKIDPIIEIDMEKESVNVHVKAMSSDINEEFEQLSICLGKRFGSSIKYSFSSLLDEEKSIHLAISVSKIIYPQNTIFLSNYNLNINEKIELGVESIAIENSKIVLSSLNNVLKDFSINKELILKEDTFKFVEPKHYIPTEKEAAKKNANKILLGKSFRTKALEVDKIKSLDIADSAVIEGRIFNLNIIKRPNINIVSFNLDCSKDSFPFKFFSKSKVELQNNIYVKVRAKKEIDNFNKDGFCFLAKDIIRIEVEDKLEVKEKRVEFNMHTKMSEMESIIDVDKAIEKASKFGYDTVAITDSGVVYGFPEAYKKASKIGDFKVIYGMEGFIVDDSLIAKNFDGKDYIVFDIETTGFNVIREKIIEIGAVKVKDGKVVDKFSSFVNPEKTIPQDCIDVVGITDDMVKDADTIDIVLPKFMKFIEGYTLIAHNAEFDMGHMKQNAKKLGLNFSNKYIDSLDISRSILINNKKHGLKDLAKHFGFDFRHHRALEDAEVTAKVIDKLLKMEDISLLKRNVKATFPKKVLIYAKNKEGLQDLYEIVSEAHLNNFRKVPKIPKSYLESKRKNLIVGASFNNGELVDYFASGRLKEEIKDSAKFYDFIEVSPIKCSDLLDRSFIEEDVKDMILFLETIGRELDIPIIATSNARYLKESESDFVKPLLYSSNKKIRDRKQYFRDSSQLIEDLSFMKEPKEAVINNTVKLAENFESFSPVPEGFYPPIIPNSEQMVRDMTYKNAFAIYGDNLPELVKNRIEKELKSIIDNGFSVLYLISHKLVNKSVSDGYLVGSRGSVGSSFVAWLTNITEVNPLPPHYLCKSCKKIEFPHPLGSGVDLPSKSCCGIEMHRDGHSIPFEVFMGFKGDKVPDIDLNFSGEYQSQVHKYVEEIFGKENVFRAGTISTLASKNAYGYARKYFEENNIPVSSAHLELYASKCENVRKTTGQHPGGMIIVPKDKKIFEFSPIQRPANDQGSEVMTTHFDYHVMDEQLVKLDILGHDDPTTLKILKEYTEIDPVKVPINDPNTIAIFNSTKSLGVDAAILGSEVGTFGIPEFGTPFARRMLADVRPTTFADLVRISGLSHGIDVWSNNAQNLIRDKVANISEVISVRDDIMTYLISKKIEKSLAFKIMEFVRKGLPLKRADDWEKYKKIMREHSVPEWYIESCGKITYMFPKGHAAAYVLMAVRIAYFKVHHPKAFYCSYLTRKSDFFDLEEFIKNKSLSSIKKIVESYHAKSRLDVKEKNELYVWEILLEMNLRGIEILPTDLYKSDSTKFAMEGEKIRAPFVVLKGMGESAANSIIAEREKPFRSFEDLKKRTKISKSMCDKAKELKLFDLKDFNQSTLF
tara:strand:- start:93929 stop:97996 length:4068 start_codon:yes stop_codon:yes gene_type:complete